MGKVPQLSKKRKIAFPHVMLIMMSLIVIFCILSYLIPAGVYDVDPATGSVIPSSFHWVDQKPINPIDAVFMLYNGISEVGSVFALLMVMGGMINMIISTKAIDRIIHFALNRLKDKALTVLIPIIMIIIAIAGTLAGNDAMITFIIIGLVLAKRMELDRITAMSIFYLPYITGQMVGPTTIILVLVHKECNLPTLAGVAVRLLLWICVTGWCIFYTVRYCRKILKDPSRSIMGMVERGDVNESDFSAVSLNIVDIASASFMLIPFIVYGVGTAAFGWGMSEMIGLAMISSFIVAILNKWTPNEFARRFMTGAGEMGGVCMLVGFGRVAGMVLSNSNIINTISYGAVRLISRFGTAGSAVGIFTFTTLFNLLMPNGLAKIPILMPLFIPVADVLGITRQVLALCYQLGDGLTNFLTPMSTVLASGLIIANVDYGKWIRYILPYALVLLLFNGAVITVLQVLGWGL